MMQMEFQDTPYTLFLGLVFFAGTTRTSLVTNFTAAPHTGCGLLYTDPTWGRSSFHCSQGLWSFWFLSQLSAW